MASSGNYAFSMDINEVVEEALEMIGGEQTLGHEPKSARRSINLLLTDWGNRGVNLWTVDTTVVTVTTSVSSYAMTSSTMDVLDMVVSRDNVDLYATRISMEEYLHIPRKGQTGRPNQYSVRRGVGNPTIHVWPIPENSTDILKFEQVKAIQDVDKAAVENADVPKRFLPALTSGLAYYMSLKRPDIPLERIGLLKQNYEELMTHAQEEDRERTSLFFKPKLNKV
jgi:hypothetical protein